MLKFRQKYSIMMAGMICSIINNQIHRHTLNIINSGANDPSLVSIMSIIAQPHGSIVNCEMTQTVN